MEDANYVTPGLMVLLVEPNPAVASHVRWCLECAGHVVLETNNTKTSHALLSGFPFDLIVVRYATPAIYQGILDKAALTANATTIGIFNVRDADGETFGPLAVSCAAEVIQSVYPQRAERQLH